MLLHVREALLSQDMTIDGVKAPLLCGTMTEAHALISGPVFFSRIINRLKELKRGPRGSKKSILLVQKIIDGLYEPKEFLDQVNQLLKLQILTTNEQIEKFTVRLLKN